MTEAAQVDEWNRTSLLCVLIANPNRDTKQRPTPFDLYDFHPFLHRQKKKPKLASELFATLAAFDGIQPEVVTETTWATPQT